MSSKVKLSVFVFVALSLIVNAQNNLSDINNFKYVIVPKQYEFLSVPDRFQINSLTKFLFNKYGYEAYFEDETLPQDLYNNRCLALTSRVNKVKGGFLKTKLVINMLDCNGNVIVTSKEGVSREKAFEKAYNIALRDAFTTFQYFKYSYNPTPEALSKYKVKELAVNNEAEKEIERLKQEVETLKSETKKIEIQNTLPNTETKKISVIKDAEPIVETPKENSTTLLYAQSIEQGYQLIDATPKIIMVLLKTPSDTVFMVKDKNAVVVKKGDKWIYSENNGEQKIEKELQIKF